MMIKKILIFSNPFDDDESQEQEELRKEKEKEEEEKRMVRGRPLQRYALSYSGTS